MRTDLPFKLYNFKGPTNIFQLSQTLIIWKKKTVNEKKSSFVHPSVYYTRLSSKPDELCGMLVTGKMSLKIIKEKLIKSTLFSFFVALWKSFFNWLLLILSVTNCSI